MYISYSPKNTGNSQRQESLPVKKKSKAGTAVFFINLLLMIAAFFTIKNQDKDRAEKQKRNDFNDTTLSDEAMPTDGNPAKLNNIQAQNPVDAKAGNNAGPGNVLSNTVPENVGIPKTAPQQQNVPVSDNNPSQDTTKKSTKTRTS